MLGAAQGECKTAIAKRLGWSLPTAGKWRGRFVAQRMAGLHDELRPGRPRSYSDERVAGLIKRVLRSQPKNATHWSVRSLAEETAISNSTVARYFALFGLQPHRAQSFKLSTDPFFVEKVRDVVGLYLNPPDNALVLCVDEKSQVQALERTQPVRPMGLGYLEGVTHDYYRHGTTTLFAALNVLDGSVISARRAIAIRSFSRSLITPTATFRPSSKVHLIADNYATHNHPRVKAWLARHPRFAIHYTPTYSSWLNQVERWFATDHAAGYSARFVSQRARSDPENRQLRALITTLPAGPSSGPLLLIQFSTSFNAFVNLLMGHHTSRPLIKA